LAMMKKHKDGTELSLSMSGSRLILPGLNL